MTDSKDKQRYIPDPRCLATLGALAGGIAHEVNNPVAAIMGFSQLALRRATDPIIRRDLDSILAEARRTGTIMEKLRTFASVPEPLKQRLDVPGLLRGVLHRNSEALKSAGVRTLTRFEADLPDVLGDPNQMRVVFENIVENAREAMIEGGGSTLVAAARTSAQMLTVSFEDDGPGIEERHIESIFEPFFSSRTVGRAAAGLGLSVCRVILARHAGSIVAESEPRQGATLTVHLPSAVAPQSHSERMDPASESGVEGYMRVLVVDDEPAVSEVLVRSLRGDGHDVEAAGGGSEAVSRSDLDSFDAILLDVRMPGMDGRAVYEHLDRRGLSTRVVFVTGDTVNTETQEFIEKAGQPVLAKPFDLRDLSVALTKLARLRRGL